MDKPSIYNSIADLVEPVIKKDDIELVDVEYKKVGKAWVLAVFIDKKEGVTIDDCQKLSREIGDLIEVNELISAPYTLEVSSPGLDRSLKKDHDFLRNQGKRIKVKTFSSIDNKKQFSGTIKSFSNQTLFLENSAGTLELKIDQIAQAKLIIEF